MYTVYMKIHKILCIVVARLPSLSLPDHLYAIIHEQISLEKRKMGVFKWVFVGMVIRDIWSYTCYINSSGYDVSLFLSANLQHLLTSV